MIWYRSYLRRFEQLAETERNKVDIPSNKLEDGSSPFAHLQKGRKTWAERVRQQSIARLGGVEPDNRRSSSSIPLISIFTRNGSGHTTLSPLQGASPEQREHLALPPTSTLSSAYLPEVRPADQPMRQEAERAFETFLKQGAEKELNVTEEMRRRCRIALEGSTHPEVVSRDGDSIQDLPRLTSMSSAVLADLQRDLRLSRDADLAPFPIVCADQCQSAQAALLASPNPFQIRS